MNRYNNALPEQLNYLTNNKYSDVEMIKKLRMAIQTGEVMSGECVKTTENGDMIVELSRNVIGMIPRNEITYIVEKDGQVHKGKGQKKVFLNVNFKVKEIQEEKNEAGQIVAILSRKDVVEEIRDRYKAELKVGHLVQGVVIGIENYGAFIDIGGDVSGILSLGEICKVFINHPSEKLSVGDAVDVIVKEELKSKKGNEILISFTREPLFKDFSKIDKQFKSGEVVKGRVKDANGAGGTGIFVEISEDFEGLADYKSGVRYNYGDKVRVRIDYIDHAKEKIKLTLIDN
jgi:small subunit ribosomal protein S1